MQTVGIIGGTGRLGSALGARLRDGGFEVISGSRDPEVRAFVVDDRPQMHEPRSNADAAVADVVVLSIPASALALVAEFREALEGKTVISPINALTGEDSAAERIAGLLPESRVATAFNHIAASSLAAKEKIDADVLVAASNDAAWFDAQALVMSIRGLRAVRCGSLAVSRPIEQFTSVLIGANRYGMKDAALRLVEQR